MARRPLLHASSPADNQLPAATFLDPIAGAVFILAVMLFAGPILAENVINLGAFDIPSDVVPWSNGLSDSEIAWDSRDEFGSQASGSVKIHVIQADANAGFFTFRRCFLVTPGLTYRFEASTLTPAGQPKTASVLAFAGYYPTSSCGGNRLLEVESNLVATVGSWQDLRMDDAVAPEFAHSVLIQLGASKRELGGAVDILFDNITLDELTGSCASDVHTLCLGDNRFSVEIEWLTTVGDEGVGKAVPMTLDSGLFWFFEPSNLEVLVKVLDACSFNPHFWIFFAATTDVNYRLTVTDTETGTIRQYINPQGELAQAVADVEAFPCQ